MRLKSNYQLGELMKLEEYPRLIELVAKFTVSSLQVVSMCVRVCNVHMCAHGVCMVALLWGVRVFM